MGKFQSIAEYDLEMLKVRNEISKEKNPACKSILIAILNDLIEERNEIVAENKNIIRENNKIFWDNNPRLFGLYSVKDYYKHDKLLLLAEHVGLPIEGELKVLEEY